MEKISLKICCGMNCLTHGGQELLDLVEHSTQYSKHFHVESVECLNTCGDGGYKSPVVELEGTIYSQLTAERLMELLDQKISSHTSK